MSEQNPTPGPIKLATLRFITINYNSFNTKFGPSAALAIEAHGPFEPAGNKSTHVAIDRDAEDSFKFVIRYTEDKPPSHPDIFEWSLTTIYPGTVVPEDGKITVTLVYFGSVEQGEKVLKFDMSPGDINGRNAYGGGPRLL